MGYGRDSRNEGLGVRDKRIGVREEWLGRSTDYLYIEMRKRNPVVFLRHYF